MKNLTKFLEESNAIENVFDQDSLEQAELAWKYCIGEDELTPGVILKTHKILMLNQPLRPDERGYFRKVPVWVGGREGMHYSQIKEAVEAWCKRTNLMVKHPGSRIEDDIKQHHVDYEKIHPFVDGNGRTGRIFLNWQRVKCDLPILVLTRDERHEYYQWFK